MSFTSLLKQDGIGALWVIEVSNDNFATIAHRWSTHACHIGGILFESRIVKLGKLQKGFGLDSVPTASTVSLVLDNTKFDMDWLLDVSSGPIEFTYRFRLSLGLFDPKALVATVDVEPTTQVMGIFGMLDSPARTDSTVEIQLADDSMGRFNEFASSPSINEWIADAGSDFNNCLLKTPGNYLPPTVDWNLPLPLVFGPNATAMPASLVTSANGGTLAAAGWTHVLVVCATTSADAVVNTDAIRLDGYFRADTMLGDKIWGGAGSSMSIPGPFPQGVTISTGDQLGRPAGTYYIWQALKTQAITKDGHNWKILYIAFNADAWSYWATNFLGYQVGVYADGTIPAGTVVTAAFPYWSPTVHEPNGDDGIAAFERFVVTGYPFSAQTSKTTQYQKGVDVLQDLISFYSAGSSADIDAASFATASAMNSTPVQQVIQPLKTSERPKALIISPVASAIVPGTLRQAIQDLAQSIAVDVYFTWAGKFAVSSTWLDFTSITSTPLAISETRMQNVRERKPSQGERWSYYNRLYIVGPDGAPSGPFDNQQAINAVGLKIARSIKGSWLMPDVSGDPTALWGLWQIVPRTEARVRNLITFQTDREALQLDLGGLFTFTWTRGNTGAVYNGSRFSVEQIAVDPASLAVDIEGVWVDDVGAGVNPYLLDQESLALRVVASGGRTVTVTDGVASVSFSSGSLVTDGVQPGDILLLLDATLGANDFARYRAVRVDHVVSASAMVLNTPDLNFEAPSGVAVAIWAIYRGKTTYPTAGSDPTNYPSGSAMYGKATDSTGVFSDSTPGNQMLDG